MLSSMSRVRICAGCAKATLTLLLILTSCTSSFAGSTPQGKLGADERSKLDALCAKAASEVEASRTVIALQERSIENLNRQLAIANDLVKNGDLLVAGHERLVKLFTDQIADAQKIIAEQRERIIRNEAEMAKLRERIDRGRWSKIRDIGLTALVCFGLGWLANSGDN